MTKISRRIVLKGIGGAALALPVLESLGPRRLFAQSQAQDLDLTYAIFMRQACGVACAQSSPLSDQREPERFWPTDPGPLTAQTMGGRAVEELLSYSDRLLIVGNVNMNNFDFGDGHAAGALQALTARGPTVEGAGGDSEAGGESIDHRIGAELNESGRESLVMYAGRDGGWLGGPCISYRGPAQRRAAYKNPKNAYDAIAGVGNLDAAGSALLANRQKSVNDLVRGQMQRLLGHPRLSGSDKKRLQLHFDSIREVESQVSCRVDQAVAQELDGAAQFFNSSDGDDVWATTRLHMDITAMAIACGYTRSVAIQVGTGNDGNNRYRDPDSGQLMENYHYVSHRRLSHDSSGAVIPNSDVLHHKVDRQFGQAFKYLLDRLSEYQMPSGKSLLEHGLSIWYNDNGNGPGHSVTNVPWIIAGSADGFLKQGEYLRLGGGGSDKNHAQLLCTIATAVGLRNQSGGNFDSFGDPSLPQGIRSELLA